LSKIVERFASLRNHFAPSGGSSIPAQGSISASQRLNLKQTSLASISNMPIEKYGGAERDRTVDPLLAKQVLSQLSYSPLCISTRTMISLPDRRDKVVGLGRFELPTSPLSGVRSNQLSYRPDSTAPDPPFSWNDRVRRLLCC
jgi:hypothetical protein